MGMRNWESLDAWGDANGYPQALERSQYLEDLAQAPFGSRRYEIWRQLPAQVRADHVDFMHGMRALFAPVSTGDSVRAGC